MNMHVGDDAVPARPADFPKAGQRGLADRDDAGVQGLGINIVIENEVKNLMCAVALCLAEKVSAALSRFPESPSRQLVHARFPHLAAAENSTRREPEPAK